uniref:Uncharacterized protein n=1 Tax=Oryza nivara TaxID=4536 RepID=A0A0E0FIJ7_ORYNI
MESGSASSASAAASTTASSPVLQLPAPPSHATAAPQDTSPTAGALAHNDAIDLTTNDDSEVLPPPGYKTQAIINELDIESVERHLANLLIVVSYFLILPL